MKQLKRFLISLFFFSLVSAPLWAEEELICPFESFEFFQVGKTCSSYTANKREVTPANQPALVFSKFPPFKTNIYDLDQQSLREGRIPQNPWATYYWPLHSGMIANRYQSNRFNGNFESKRQQVLSYTLKNVVDSGDGFFRKLEKKIRRLSPAEKYDLITGQIDAPLTRAIWEDGKRYNDMGRMQGWYGVCEGAVSAAVQMPEPVQPVTLRSLYKDLEVTFEAKDIKALASLLWSSYVVSVPILGSRCFTDRYTTGPNGEVTQSACFDVNPASWHISILNLIGLQKTALYGDYAQGAEVWNSPILSYQFTYFNPTNRNLTTNLSQAKVLRSQWQQDPFSYLRHPDTHSIVGVQMKVVYGLTSGYIRKNGSKPMDEKEETYFYDLELNSQGQVIGGEWQDKETPDFLWAIPKGMKPFSSGDYQIGLNQRWNTKKVPSSWRTAIRRSSEQIQPLHAIVRRLVELSRKP